MEQVNLKLTKRVAMLMSIVACLPLLAHSAPVARVDFAIGNVQAIASNGQSRQVGKGTPIDEGEMIATNNGRAQLRFTDGAQVSLQPQSEFRIDKYKFQGQQDGSEQGFFSLLKGGLRTITGLIGRSNKQNYQVNTTVATIGIRGTEYTIQYGSSITGTVGEGEIEVCNGAGCLNVTNGESYYVQNQDVKPVLTNKGTDLPPAPPANPPSNFVQGEKVGPTGFPALFALIGTRLLDYVEGDLCDGACTGFGSGTFVFDAEGVLVSVNGTPVTSVRMGGNDGIMAWGTYQPAPLRAVNQLVLVDSLALIGGQPLIHFAAGLPADLTNLGGTVGTYSLIGATPVTDSLNSVVGSLNDAILKVDFKGAPSAQVDMAWTINNAPLSASLTGPVTGANLSLNGNCGGNCFVGAVGTLFGPNAVRAGIVYDINGSLIGAAAFAK